MGSHVLLFGSGDTLNVQAECYVFSTLSQRNSEFS